MKRFLFYFLNAYSICKFKCIIIVKYKEGSFEVTKITYFGRQNIL